MSLPSAVVTLIRPVIAPEGTRTANWLELTPVGAAATTPLKRTTGFAPFRFAPVILTEVPTGPEVGENPEIVGGTTKLLEENPEAPGTATRIKPVLAPAGTTIDKLVLFRTERFVVEAPLKDTAVVPSRFLPMIVTLVFTRPEFGETLAIVGLPKKLEVVTAIPKGVFTAIGPLLKPTGAWTWIRVSEFADKMIDRRRQSNRIHSDRPGNC